ncbi:MAG: DUF4339 domain-containing protein [Bacteriovoracaceae bacterium]|nr:DUF4339 domain-containing protein [Bacteriovoracaceae bacterium]
MNWFVIKENEHLGPFQDEDLKRLHINGEISNSTMLWRDGMGKAQSYEDLFVEVAPPAFNIPIPTEEEDEVPPPLPPEVLKAPSKQHLVSSVSEAAEKVESVVPEFNPPPTPVAVPTEQAQDEPIAEQHLEDDVEPESNSRGPNLFKIFATIAVLLIIIGGAGAGWFYYASQFKPFPRPNKMSLNDYNKLIQTAQKEGQNQFAIAMAGDKSGLWVATNSPFRGEVSLKLNSIDGKVLSTKKVVAQSTGTLENRVIEFKNFEFEQGQRLVDGMYNVEIRNSSNLEVPLVAKFSKKQQSFDFSQQMLLTSFSKEAFERALTSFEEKQKTNDSIFWEELLQKYQTVNAMSLKIEKAMSKIFQSDSNHWNNSIENFEKEYIRNFGNFFTSFVIQNEFAYEDLKRKEFHNKVEVVSSYTRLTKIAKRVGAETMRALELLKSVKDPQNGRERLEAENKIKKSFKTISTTVSERIESLRDKSADS